MTTFTKTLPLIVTFLSFLITIPILAESSGSISGTQFSHERLLQHGVEYVQMIDGQCLAKPMDSEVFFPLDDAFCLAEKNRPYIEPQKFQNSASYHRAAWFVDDRWRCWLTSNGRGQGQGYTKKGAREEAIQDCKDKGYPRRSCDTANNVCVQI